LNRLRNNYLFLFGSTTALIFGLLAAFISGLAYVTVYTFSELPLDGPVPFVKYSPLELGFHPATLGLLLASAGSLIALFSLIATEKKAVYLGSAGITLGNIGLLLSAWPRTSPSLSISYYYIQIPWVSTILTLIGVSIMFVSFASKNKISRLSLLSLPILILIYSTYPIMIISNNLPLLPRADQTVVGLIPFLIAGHLLMLYGTFKGSFKTLKKPTEI